MLFVKFVMEKKIEFKMRFTAFKNSILGKFVIYEKLAPICSYPENQI